MNRKEYCFNVARDWVEMSKEYLYLGKREKAVSALNEAAYWRSLGIETTN